MAIHYNVAHVREAGVELEPIIGNEDRQPDFSNRLVMLLYNGSRWIAVDVTDHDEFTEFRKWYRSGNWMIYKLYDYDGIVPEGYHGKGLGGDRP